MEGKNAFLLTVAMVSPLVELWLFYIALTCNSFNECCFERADLVVIYLSKVYFVYNEKVDIGVERNREGKLDDRRIFLLVIVLLFC
jgi:hypothetical protein